MAKAPQSSDQNQSDKPASSVGVEITYTPRREDPTTVTWGKITFEANKPRVINDPRIIAKAKTNPWFKVAGEKQAEAGYDPAVDEPKNATQYRAYAITWIKLARSSKQLEARWNSEEEMRAKLDVASDDLDMIARHYDVRLEELKRAELAGEAQ